MGPVWYGGHKNEGVLLASCYRESLQIAVDNQLISIAFPAISCGAYGFPIDKACGIAVGEVCSFIENSKSKIKVLFVCFDERIERTISKELDIRKQ